MGFSSSGLILPHQPSLKSRSLDEIIRLNKKVMAKSKFEEMFDRLPTNIKETEILRLPSKKVLAALLELLLHSEARESRVIYAPNARLRKLSGISSNDLLPSIEQLIDYDLITRKVGKVRKEGEKGEASEYIINLKKLKEPLVEKTFDDLFSEFLEGEESLEMPINTAITTTISNTTSTLTTTPNSISSSTINSTSTENTSSIVNVSSTSSQIQEQNQMELEKPNNYRDLMEYFKKRMIEETKDKNLDELNEIQESLKDELDSFNEINGYKNIYRFFIKPSMEKKKEELVTKEFEECITKV
jgi:hypothetical protein